MSEVIPEDLSRQIDFATDMIRQFKGAVVALSAGVDSSLVALLAHRALGDRAVAVTGQSESLPPEELEVAKSTAQSIGIRHVIVTTRELENPDYSSNSQNRCYYCKETLYSELRKVADNLGFDAILDGTQIDDLGDDRPGLQAAKEAGVVSPLLVASFSKANVRESARLLGLAVWDKPAMPCLSSRVAHSEEITPEKLNMIGQAELFVRQLTGVKNLRVRDSGGLARIEVSPEERKKLFNEKILDRIDRELRRLGYARVTLDLRGYSSSRDEVLRDPQALPMANVAQ